MAGNEWMNLMLDPLTTTGKAALLHYLVERIFQETEEVVDLKIAPEDLWECAFQLKDATDKYLNVLQGRCPTCEPEAD